MASKNVQYGVAIVDCFNNFKEYEKDKAGYRKTILGGCGVFNESGEFYDEESSLQLLNSSTFINRLKAGKFFGENGHPKRYDFPEGPEGDVAYLRRAVQTDERNICCHHRWAGVLKDGNKVFRTKDKYGRDMVPIYGWTKPAGPQNLADSLESDFNNPYINLAFSIRSFTSDSFKDGYRFKVMKEILNFDKVTENGISTAEKGFTLDTNTGASLAMESLANRYNKDNLIIDDYLAQAILDKQQKEMSSGLSTESLSRIFVAEGVLTNDFMVAVPRSFNF